MRTFASLAAVSALALLSAETGSGSTLPDAPPAPTPEELEAAEKARAEAVEILAKAKDDAAALLAEADQVTKDAAEAKARADELAKEAAETKAKAEAESKAAKDATKKAKGDQAELEKALAAVDTAKAALAAAQEEPAPAPTDEPYLGPRQAIVWAAPGHAMLAVGVLISVPADEAEALRARGRARFASDEEVEAAGDDIPELQGL